MEHIYKIELKNPPLRRRKVPLCPGVDNNAPPGGCIGVYLRADAAKQKRDGGGGVPLFCMEPCCHSSYLSFALRVEQNREAPRQPTLFHLVFLILETRVKNFHF